VDLDATPWNGDSGIYAEPAMTVRLLVRAREEGWIMHFFASLRSLRASPSLPEAILNDGHDLDWLCTKTEVAADFPAAAEEFREFGHEVVGLVGEGVCPEGAAFSAAPDDPEAIAIRPNELFKTDPELDALAARVSAELAAGRKMTTYRRV
jgi:hypothetical protein